MRTVICGAGIAGLALAHRLADAGWEVVVLERAPGPRPQGYMIDFFGPGYDAAEVMGVLPRLRELGYRVPEACYVDARGRRRASLDFTRFAETVGGRLTSIMRPDLERALRESLPRSVQLRFGTTLDRVGDGGVGPHAAPGDGGVRAHLSDGSFLDADLLVGADGIHSTVRGQVFGPPQRYLRYLGFHTAAFTIADPEIRAEVGDRFCLTDTVGRQVGCYGLRDGRVAVFTVHRTPDPALPADPRAEIRRVYGSLGWVVPRVLAQCPPAGEVYYDQVTQVEIPRWTSGRVVLVGDACQAVSLLAGQGASLAVAGAFVLAEQLARASTVEGGLAGYEREWRSVVEEKQRVAREAAAWFVPDAMWRLRLRRAALALARLPGADRLLASALVGKSTALIRNLDATRIAAE